MTSRKAPRAQCESVFVVSIEHEGFRCQLPPDHTASAGKLLKHVHTIENADRVITVTWGNKQEARRD